MTTNDAGVVVIGAGHAGMTCATTIRDLGYAGPVTMIGDDPDGAYRRPPLSKGHLTGTAARSELNQHGSEHLLERDIDFLTGIKADRIDRSGRTVRLEDGRSIPYRVLVLATGSVPRMPGVEGLAVDGVMTLRTLADADELHRRLAAARSLVVIGGGFIGLEVASGARTLGLDTTIIETRQRLLERGTSGPVAQYFELLHRRHGARIRLGERVTRLHSDGGGGIASVETSAGATIDAQVVVIGAGASPSTLLAERAGLSVDDGVLVNESLETDDEHIFAIGDIARFRATGASATVRLESVQNALDQARLVANSIVTGRRDPYQAVPWFWTEQHGVKLQMAGSMRDVDTIQIVPRARAGASAAPAAGGFSVMGFAHGVLQSVESVDAAPDHIRARRLLASGAVYEHYLRRINFDLRVALRELSGTTA